MTSTNDAATNEANGSGSGSGHLKMAVHPVLAARLSPPAR